MIIVPLVSKISLFLRDLAFQHGHHACAIWICFWRYTCFTRSRFQCTINRIQSSLSGCKTNRCTWTVLWNTWKILPKRVSEHVNEPEQLPILINQSKAHVHAERSHVSWGNEVLCYLATVTQIAGSANSLRLDFAVNRMAQVFFPPELSLLPNAEIVFFYLQAKKVRTFTENVCFVRQICIEN